MRGFFFFGQRICAHFLAISVFGVESAIPTRPLASDYLIQVYTTADGLPDNRVFAIDQDTEGYLWLGTQAGIACYDGARFTHWNPANLPQLTDQKTLRISLSPDGKVWFVSRRELISLDGARVMRFAAEEFPLPNFTVGPLLAERDGLWMAANHGLIRIGSNRISKYSLNEGLPNRAITALHHSTGVLWVGTAYGLAKYDSEKDRFTTQLGNRTFLGQSVVALLEDSHDVLWMIPAEAPHATNPRRIAYFQDERWNFLNAPEVVNGGRVNGAFLVEDSHGRIWAPAGPRGLYRLGARGLTLLEFPKALLGDFPLSFKEDRHGNLWVGMENRGLIKLQPKRVTMVADENGVPLHPESLLAASDGSVWIGTTDNVFRMSEGDPIAVPADRPFRNVRALMEDRNGHVWLGTRDALMRIENEEARTVFAFTNMTEPPKIKALLEAEDGAIWAGTIRGVYRFQGGDFQVWTAEDSLAAKEVRALAQDSEGRIWAGMLGAGINVYENENWTLLTEEDGLASNYVWDIYRDAYGYLWIATRLGLSIWDGERIFTFQDGLNHEIQQIVADDSGGLWFTSPRGVCRIERDSLLTNILYGASLPKIWYYDRQEGLPDLSFAGVWSQGGGLSLPESGLLLACDSGLVRFQLGASTETPVPVPAIEQISANQTVLYRSNPFTDNPEGDSADLPISSLNSGWRFEPGTAQLIEFAFSSPSFRSPARTRFSYRLLGVSDKWRNVGQTRHATFANLAPGSYTFELLAENKYGAASINPARFSFVVEPHLTQTTTFYALAAGALALCLATLHLWRLKKMARIADLEAQVQLAAQRETFARSMHDELGAEISAIARLTAISDRSADFDATARLTRVGEIARDLSHTVRDSIWAATPEHDSLEETLSKIREYATRFLSDAGVERSIRIPDDLPDQGVPGEFRKGVVLLVKEALHNAVKHSQATEISLQISCGENLIMEVRDNGRGFDPNSSHSKGRGLKDLRDVTNELQGRIDILSHPGAGTQVLVTIPLP